MEDRMTRYSILLVAALMTFGFRGSDNQGEFTKKVNYTLHVDSKDGSVLSFEGACLSKDDENTTFKYIKGTTPFSIDVNSVNVYCLFKKTSGKGMMKVAIVQTDGSKEYIPYAGGGMNAVVFIHETLDGFQHSSGIRAF